MLYTVVPCVSLEMVAVFVAPMHIKALDMLVERAQSDIDLPGTPPGLDVGARPSPQQLEETLAGIKSAGALFPGDALVYQVGACQVSQLRTSSLT